MRGLRVRGSLCFGTVRYFSSFCCSGLRGSGAAGGHGWVGRFMPVAMWTSWRCSPASHGNGEDDRSGADCATLSKVTLSPGRWSIGTGLHTAECEVIGDKLGGIAVHIGARVAALAAP